MARPLETSAGSERTARMENGSVRNLGDPSRSPVPGAGVCWARGTSKGRQTLRWKSDSLIVL